MGQSQGRRILVVDDDVAIARLVSDALEDEGYEVSVLNDGMEAYQLLTSQSGRFALIILDIMMPGMDGLELCVKIRDTVKCPIIFVTAKNRTIDTLVGLEMGGDDYVYKPFVVEELVARVRAHIRRDTRGGVSSNGIIKIGALELRSASYEVFKDGKLIPLSTREFQLLQYLMENAERVLTREQIFNAVWGTNYGDIGTVAVNIKNLRAKIDPDCSYIKTVWGVGYKFANE